MKPAARGTALAFVLAASACAGPVASGPQARPEGLIVLRAPASGARADEAQPAGLIVPHAAASVARGGEARSHLRAVRPCDPPARRNAAPSDPPAPHGIAAAHEVRPHDDSAGILAFVTTHPEVRALVLTAGDVYDDGIVRGVAVEDATGVKVCVDGPAPDDAPAPRTSPACFREAGARLGVGPTRAVMVGQAPALMLPLDTPDGEAHVRLYEPQGVVLDVRRGRHRARPARGALAIGDVPFHAPWYRSAASANRHGVAFFAQQRRVLPSDTSPATVPAVSTPEVARWLAAPSEVEVALVDRSGSRSISAVHLPRDAEGFERSVLVVRDGATVVADAPEEEDIFDARFADALAPGVVLALSEPGVGEENGSLDVPEADELALELFQPAGDRLVRHVLSRVGENGFTRFYDRSDAWRIYFRARVLSVGCIDLRLDFAWEAWFSRRTGRFTHGRRLALVRSHGDGDQRPGIGFSHVAGRYRLVEGALAPGRCGPTR